MKPDPHGGGDTSEGITASQRAPLGLVLRGVRSGPPPPSHAVDSIKGGQVCASFPFLVYRRAHSGTPCLQGLPF